MARRIWLDLDARIGDHGRAAQDLWRGVLRVEVETDAGLLDRRLAIGRIVHLEAEGLARRDPGARAFRIDGRLRADGIAARAVRQQVVNRLAIARLDGRGAQPATLCQRVLHFRVLVVDHARSRDRVFRQFDDQVRLSKFPLGRSLGIDLQRVRALSARRAGFDPVDQRRRILGLEVHVRRERVDMRVGIVGRHAIRADRLADHARPLLDLLVAVHRERTDGAFRVAGDAVLGEDRRDFLLIRNLRVCRLVAVREGELRCRHVDVRCGHRLAGLQPVDCGIQLCAGRAGIDDLPRLRIDHHRLRRVAHTEALADELRVVDEHRQVEVQRLQVGGDGLARHTRRRVHQEELRIRALQRCGKVPDAQRGVVQVGGGDGVAHDHDGRRELVVAQQVGAGVLVNQAEIVRAVSRLYRARDHV